MSIKNKVIQINREDCRDFAEELFVKISGLNQKGNKFDKLRVNAEKVKSETESRIDIKAVYSYFDDIVFDGKTLVIGGEKFICNAFEQLDEKQIKGAYVYVLTAGDFYLEDKIMEQLLADLWGTAFTDAARAMLEKELQKNDDLSNAFGPGFYGMNVSQMKDIAKLVDCNLIGTKVNDGSLLIPVKSCGGIYFAVDDTFEKLNAECEDCKGTSLSCSLCNVIKIKEKTHEGKDKNFKCLGICSACGRCKDAGMMEGANKRKTKMLTLPKDFKPQTGDQGYGVAFDIGTTTVVGMLIDLYEGKELGALAKTNPQNKYGLDVISRITFSNEKEENLQLLRKSIVKCMNEIIEELCKSTNVNEKAIMRVTVDGNTTMSHIFAGYNPATLARAPFHPAYTGTLFFDIKKSGLHIAKDGTVMVLPNIAGHVGGDITAGILATRLLDESELTLFIDIGTNGEIVITDGKTTLACSTAAGPAFEGAAIFQGMRAAKGAIERVVIKDEEVVVGVIEDGEPMGICGSGLIDAVAEMVKKGIIKKTGRIASSDEIKKKNPTSKLADRVRERNSEREFVLVEKANGEDIVITQNDIREVQLAKGAISAGINIMLEKLGEAPEKIKKIVIAGAFGNFINKESAIVIGLLPRIELDKIISAGNAAGAGVLMSVINADEAVKTKKIPDKIQHVELAEAEDFQNQYLKAMAFI